MAALCAEPATRWSSAPAASFDHRLWDGEMVVHVLRTGETHALDALTTLVLSTLLADPASGLPAADWLQRMIAAAPGAEDEAEPSAEELQVFERALTQLRKLGLVMADEPASH